MTKARFKPIHKDGSRTKGLSKTKGFYKLLYTETHSLQDAARKLKEHLPSWAKPKKERQ